MLDYTHRCIPFHQRAYAKKVRTLNKGSLFLLLLPTQQPTDHHDAKKAGRGWRGEEEDRKEGAKGLKREKGNETGSCSAARPTTQPVQKKGREREKTIGSERKCLSNRPRIPSYFR